MTSYATAKSQNPLVAHSTLICVVIAAVLIAAMIATLATAIGYGHAESAPVSGTVVHMSSHPESYPNTSGVPVLFCVSIQSADATSVTVWYVSPETYALYAVGDTVRKGETRVPPQN